MKDDHAERLISAVQAHGDQLGGNLVHLKNFLDRLQNEQQTFLAAQRDASDRAQSTAKWAAIFSAFAAIAAALATLVQAGVAFQIYNQPVGSNINERQTPASQIATPNNIKKS